MVEGDHFFEEDGVQKWERDPINVGLVKIEGNEKTKDFVIRRELAISPGEPFDLGKMENSRIGLKGFVYLKVCVLHRNTATVNAALRLKI